MKIAFITSSLEEGQDGVGDYTRLLSQECVRQGHSCSRIALNDRWVAEIQRTDGSDDGVAEMRLPADLSWPQRIKQAQDLLISFAPDWVSLQFVPYGFHKKGLIHGLARSLQLLCEKRQTHIMFHELWIGEPAGSPWRHQIVGAAQKQLILQMVKRISPQVIHTSNSLYVSLLGRHGYAARRLALFGNVPVSETDGNAWLSEALRRSGVEITPANRAHFWLAGFFGALPPDWPPEPVFSLLRQTAAQHQRRVVILSAGSLVSGEPLWQELTQHYSPEFTFLKLGSQSAERISQYLNSLDFGIATTAYSRIGKSGSVAAMLDHGLPVIVNRDDERFPGVQQIPQDHTEPLLHKLDGLQESLDIGLKRQPARARLPATAAQFIADLRNIGPTP